MEKVTTAQLRKKRSEQILRKKRGNELKEKVTRNVFLFERESERKRSHVLKNNCLPC
jgi:hypothetical protein